MVNLIQSNYDRKHFIKINPTTPVSFKGNAVTATTEAISGGIKWIEKGGVLVDFLFVDALGMVLPRTYQAFNRNKEELGHPNYKAGVEELIREVFTGPSMFVIPMGFIALSKKLFGTASQIQHQTLDSLTDSFKDHLTKDPLFENSRQLKDKFYTNLFKNAFAEHKKVAPENVIQIDSSIEKIVKNIGLLETEKDKGLIKSIKEEIITTVSNLNKAHSLNLNNSHSIILKDNLTNKNFTKNIGPLVEDLTKYSKDVVEKIAEKGKNIAKEQLPNLLESIHNVKSNGRKFNFIATVLSTAGFLYVIPMMYKRNAEFPGIDGLTAKKKELANKAVNKYDDAFKIFQAKTVEKPNAQKKTVSFSGSGNQFFRALDFDGHSAPHAILGLYTLGIILGARLFQARNADERREVATRDFSGLTTIVFAIPVLRNITSTIARKVTGFPISSKLSEGLSFITDHLRPKKGVQPMSFDNINDLYSNIDKYKNGLVDFSENISKHGGNLQKIFDFLTDDSKKALNEIAATLGSSGEKINNGFLIFLTSPFKSGKAELLLPSTNEQIIKLLKKAQTEDKLKPLLDKVTKEISKEGNHLVKFAEALKSIPEMTSIIGVSAFLGWFLPWFNINYTKNLYKKKNNVTPIVTTNSSIDKAIIKFINKSIKA